MATRGGKAQTKNELKGYHITDDPDKAARIINQLIDDIYRMSRRVSQGADTDTEALRIYSNLDTDSGTASADDNNDTASIVGGEGIDTSASGDIVTVAGEDASDTNKGIASFNEHHFAVTSGDVFLNKKVLPNGVLVSPTVTDEGGLNVQWSAGAVFVDGSTISTLARGTDLAMTDDTVNYIYATVAGDTTLVVSTTNPNGSEHALVATVYTAAGDIEYLLNEDTIAGSITATHAALDDLHAALVHTGLNVAEDTDATNANDFTVASGSYYLHAHEKETIASTLYSAGAGHGDNNLKRYYHSSGSWTNEMSNGVDFGFWDNGTDKTAVNVAKWYVGWVFIEGAGNLDYTYPQTEHNTELSATLEAIAYPPAHEGFVVPLAKFVFRGGASAFGSTAYFDDIRPFHGAEAASSAVQNLWSTFTADSGSTTADSTVDSMALTGGTGVTTSISGDACTFAIGQAVGTGDSPSFVAVTASTGNITATSGDVSAKDAGIVYAYSAGDDKHVKMQHNDTNAVFTVTSGDARFELPSAKAMVVQAASGGVWSTPNMELIDSDTLGAGKGGNVSFGGNYTGSTKTTWATIKGQKENATDGQYGGELSLQTRAHGGSTTERMRIGSGGEIFLLNIPSGATQAAAGAAANELWKTASHATLPDNVVMIGV
jgi:hypothetical protein